MSSVRVTPRVRPQARQSAVKFRPPGPSASATASPSRPPSARRVGNLEKAGVLPAPEQPDKFKDCAHRDIWVVAEKILAPLTDTSPVDPSCGHCKRPLEITRSSLPAGWRYSCPTCATKTHTTSPRSWSDCIFTVLLNLQQAFDEKSFHHREEICAYIDTHWQLLCGTRERTATWWKTVFTTLTAHNDIFLPLSVTDRTVGSSKWTLIEDASHRAVKREQQRPASPKQATPRRVWVAPTFTPMHSIPLDDEDEIELQLPAPPVPKRSHKRRASNLTNNAVRSHRAKPTNNSGRTLIQRAHIRIAEERKSKSRTGVMTERGCHHCRIVRAGLWRCCGYAQGTSDCVRKFCYKCIEKYEQAPVDPEHEWTCLVCRSVCKCARCQHEAVVGPQLALRRKTGAHTRSSAAAGGGEKRSHHKDKREHKKRRTSDYDIFKVVYHGVPLENVRIAAVSAKEIVIPTWRPSEGPPRPPPAATPPVTPTRRSHKRGAGSSRNAPIPAAAGAVVESDGEEETNDDAFEARHKRAADRLRNELFPGKDPAMTRV